MTILDYALATADAGLSVFPLKPLTKLPLHKGWQDEATTDPAIITRWFSENPHINYGVRTGLTNNLHVIDLDGPTAQKWWLSLGIPSGAKIVTPSGADRTHLYYRIDDVEMPNTAHKLHPNVDTRGEGGFVVGPGSMLATGTYTGSLRHIPVMPAELLAMMPEKQVYSTEEYDGEQVEAASDSELRQTQNIIAALEDLPLIWVEGAGWRTTLYRVACWLARMVNSPAYAMTVDGAVTILLTYMPTNSEWGHAEILEQWESARKTTEGQYAELPDDGLPSILPFIEVMNLLPAVTSAGLSFTAKDGLLFGHIMSNESSALWRIRQQILIESLHAGLTPQQAGSVVWGSKAAAPLLRDQNGERVLWAEVEKAQQHLAEESGENALALPDSDRPDVGLSDTTARVTLLTDEERAEVAGYVWFGSRYLDWAATRVSMMNGPYHRMNRWTILSLVFSDCGFIPKKKGPVGVNLFQMVLGNTTTGKTEAYDVMDSVIVKCFPAGDSPDIGGDATSNSLVEKLIERDGKPSLFNADEAHGLFEEMGVATWRAGLRQKWTQLFEGKVPMMLRSSKKDVSGQAASTYFTMHLMGTTGGMMQVLDSEFWTSGFLARFLFCIGEQMEATADSYEEEDQEGDVVAGYEAMPRQWAAEFDHAKEQLRSYGLAMPMPIGMEMDARRRHVEFKRFLGAHFAGHRQSELIKPTLIRFGINIRKCASLVAMSEGKATISRIHELVALEQAEEWLGTMLRMVEGTTESGFTRQVNEVERFIASQPQQEVRLERVYAHFKLEKRVTDGLIQQLAAEGRISRNQVMGDNAFLLKLKRELTAA